MSASISDLAPGTPPKDTSFRMLALPREMRDNIYRNILTPDTGIQECSSYGMTPSILRVNKQIYDEARSVLYDKNCWVIFQTDLFGTRRIMKNLRRYGAPFSLLSGTPLPFGGTPAIQVDLRVNYSHPDHQTVGLNIVVSAHGMQRLVHVLYRVNGSFHALDVQANKALSRFPRHRERLINTLQETHVLSSISIRGLQPQKSIDELAHTMCATTPTTEDFILRAHTYKRRGDRELAAGNFLEAATIYKDGFYSTQWGGTKARIGRQDIKSIELNRANATLMIHFAWCCINLKFIEQAHRTLDRILAVNKPLCFKDQAGSCSYLWAHPSIDHHLVKDRLTRNQRAAALYYKGLAYLAEDIENPATYCLLLALIQKPGYQAVDKELDRLEERLVRDPQSEYAVVLSNVKQTLGPYRHKPVDYAGPSSEQILRFTWDDMVVKETMMEVSGRDVISMVVAIYEQRSPHVIITD